MSPQLIELIEKAVYAIQADELNSAKLLLNEALEIEVNQPEVLRLLGVVAAVQVNWGEALRFIDLSIASNPENGISYSNRGNVLAQLGRHEEALTCYEKAIALLPNYAEAYSNQGNTLYALGRHDEALTCYEKAVQIDVNYAQAFYGAAYLFSLHKKYDYALGCCEQAIRINPTYELALALKGDIHFQVKDYEAAITAYDAALLISPESPAIWIAKGNIYAEMKQFKEAGKAFGIALALAPDTDFLLGLSIQNGLQMCEWGEQSNKIKQLVSCVGRGEKAAIPYNLISLLDDRKLIRRSIEVYAKSILGDIERIKQSKIAPKAKIRLGYFSADFHDHPTAHLMAELFECHNKNQFELVAFVYGRNTPDEMRKRLEQSFDQFIDVNDKTEKEIAGLAREMEIDIAIDLKGFTGEGRPQIFMHGAAPIQISYLGFPGTMGLSCFDYVIADPILIPDQFKDGMVEKIIFMPDSYQVNDRKRPIAASKNTREECGLPPSGFVFCCFNNNYKITPTVMDGWARILTSVEGSVLWLFGDNPFAISNLKMEAEKRGLHPDRLIFAGRISAPDHLARYRLADLFLDTTPCNAHTTASDALWAGLPVLTLAGESFGARVAASLNHAVGLSDLVVNTQAEYERLAVRIAQDPEYVQGIKSRLKDNLMTAPLFDTPLFTKNLEAAYCQAYKSYQLDLEPDHIYVDSLRQ
jgi:predicted O-linked N-acetylglucosamine transferase (SPINDLY family)